MSGAFIMHVLVCVLHAAATCVFSHVLSRLTFKCSEGRKCIQHISKPSSRHTDTHRHSACWQVTLTVNITLFIRKLHRAPLMTT